MSDTDAIIILLRACVQMTPEKCRNTLREALAQMDKAKASAILSEPSD